MCTQYRFSSSCGHIYFEIVKCADLKARHATDTRECIRKMKEIDGEACRECVNVSYTRLSVYRINY
jgi:hypothetical protein